MRKLIKGIQHFQTHYFASHREMFEELSLGQHPKTLFITCCDSRIDPNLITQTEPGELGSIPYWRKHQTASNPLR